MLRRNLRPEDRILLGVDLLKDPAILVPAYEDAQGITAQFNLNILARINQEITFDTDPTGAATTAAESFALRRGVCQDLTHVFIASAREIGFPARYVAGYFHRADGVVRQEAGHAWAEAHVEGLGWVAFDAANGICSTDAHIRVAVGLDYLGAAPVRGTRYGGGEESLAVTVIVDQAQRQMQN